MLGRRRRSRTFTAGLRREIGRNEVLVSDGLPGFGRGITIACFHSAGILAVLMELLKMLQRKWMPLGPRCFRWRIVILSGPAAVEFLHFRIVSATMCGEKGFRLLFSLWVAWILRIVFLVVGLEECRDTLVNCLLKRFAMESGLVRILEPNLIGWLGGGWVFLPDNERMRSQNFFGLVLGVADVMCLLQVSVNSWPDNWEICWFSVEISGFEGSAVRSWSR